MTIRVKVRILLLVSVSLTVFYIISHVYRLNSWFTEKSVVLKQEGQPTTFQQDEAAIDSTGDYIQFNATKNTVKPTTHDDVKIQTFQPTNDDILTQHQPDNRSNSSAKYTSLQPQDGGRTHPKHVENKASVQDSETTSGGGKRGAAKGSPASEIAVLPGVTSKSFPTERSGKATASDKSIIPDNYTDLTNDEFGSGVMEEEKATSTDTNLGSGNVSGDMDEAVVPEKNEISAVPEVPPPTTPTVSILSPSSAPKIYFESETNKTKHVETSVPETPPIPPISPKEHSAEEDCAEHEGINERKSRIKSKCDLYSNHLKTCTESAKYYTKEKLAASTNCSEKKHSPICYFTNSSRTDESSKLHLKCNYSVCHKNEVRVGILNATSGIVSYMVLSSLKTIVRTLEEEAEFDNKEHRVDFIFLSCKLKNKKRRIHQILPFPPLVLKTKSERKYLMEEEKEVTKMNVNIVVLDSLSRKHFYRTLTQTADAMRAINTDAESPNTVLDFKGFQSLAPFTYVNLQALLTGNVDYESATHLNSRRYNFKDLFGVFIKSGYQTLLQEDTCWHDEWGSILTGNRRLDKQDPHFHKKIWEEIKNLTEGHGIDGFGLTHMSCDVLAKYGVTNLFNSDDFVCFNGNPLSAYFLEHVLDNLVARKMSSKDMPLLSYTHINIAHESSGNRIISLDSHLANFISVLGKLKNTFTILLSDHGGKTTDYARDTLAGRFEVYDPFLFMMVPKQLADTVGEKNMRNLIVNQNSLLDVIDIRSMLLTLNEILKDKSLAITHSLLTDSIKHRTDCQHISIRNYGLCKCFSNVTFPDKKDERYKEFLIWLGEFAVGHVNNMLSHQQTYSRLGYKCHRIKANNKANTIRNVVERHSSRGVVYLFDISTKFDDGIEVFNFQVLFDEKRKKKELLTVEHWMRVSIYSRYASCRDKNVSHELCLCSQSKREKISKKYLNHYRQFSMSTETLPIVNSTCAFLLRRTNNYVATFELVNMCVKKLNIEFSTPVMYSWASSHNLPVEVSVKAHSIHFLVTFIKIVDFNEIIRPKIVIKK